MCAHQVLTGSSPHFLGLAERWAKQNFRVTSKADEKTFSVHNSIVSFFQGMSCLLCCAQKYLCIMSQDFKSTNRKKISPKRTFFSCSSISSPEIDEKLSTLQQDFLPIGITSHDHFHLSLHWEWMLLCEA